MQISISNAIASAVNNYGWASLVINKYINRVKASGGYIEGIDCIKGKLSK
jgi:hypothetical protein